MGRLTSLGANWVYRGEYNDVADDLQIVRGLSLQDMTELLQVFPIVMNTTVGIGPRKELEAGRVPA